MVLQEYLCWLHLGMTTTMTTAVEIEGSYRVERVGLSAEAFRCQSSSSFRPCESTKRPYRQVRRQLLHWATDVYFRLPTMVDGHRLPYYDVITMNEHDVNVIFARMLSIGQQHVSAFRRLQRPDLLHADYTMVSL